MKGFAFPIAAIAIAASLAACTPDIMLKSPDNGQTVVCKGGASYGLIGLPARNLQYRCLDDYQKQGYQRTGDAK